MLHYYKKEHNDTTMGMAHLQTCEGGLAAAIGSSMIRFRAVWLGVFDDQDGCMLTSNESQPFHQVACCAIVAAATPVEVNPHSLVTGPQVNGTTRREGAPLLQNPAALSYMIRLASGLNVKHSHGGTVMRTHLLDGVPPLGNDQKILTMLNFAASKVNSDKGIYRVGITNAQGQVYRIVEAHGLNEACRLVKALGNLGLAEEITPQAEEFSSTFSELR